MDYEGFISRKLSRIPPTGLSNPPQIIDGLFPHQAALVDWALRRGRCAIFADTGLGKTRMELAWADAIYRQTGVNVLILAPLAVAAQTVREGLEVGVAVTHIREPEDFAPGICIVNYERIQKIDPRMFGAVILDESSIIKHHTSKTLKLLMDAFRATPFKLCATATPAPNDWTELGTHAEFLGICTQSEMLAEYFVHDGGETQVWRLKGHARDLFWRFVSSWGAMVRKPSDLGFEDGGYDLPPLHVSEHIAATEAQATDGMLFALEANTLSERRNARRASMTDRVKQAADRVNADSEQWMVWCDLNAESEALTKAIPGAVEVRGSDDASHKEKALMDFADGRIRVLVSKPSICGFGLNFQRCSHMAFVGVTDSYEAFYQAVRRCWRFGQKRPVNVHIYASELEGAIVANLKRKEADASAMAASLSAETREAVMAAVRGSERKTNVYNASTAVKAPSFLKGITG